MAAAVVVSVTMGVMKPVLSKLATLMDDEYKKIKGLHKEVGFLQRELGDMDALLEKMDSADELDPQAKKWRRDIIEMSYKIEDNIDDFMHSVGEAKDKIGILRKSSHYVKTFKDRRRLANDLQEIKALVIEASDRRKRYMLDQCISVTMPVVVDPRLKALYKESASLVGIESQKDELVSWTKDEVKQLKFMAIVGFGGIGKTTLANEVYREVGGKFECKAFISVSQKPDMIVLFNSLLSQLGLPTYNHACLLQDPINDLRRHLHDKRYFIIVDDLWDSQAWGAIQCAFPQSNRCSKVIITTRNENVATSCCHNHGCIHNMKHLSDKDSRKLFFDRIFGSEDACPTELKKASCEILKKCGGLPLAIITTASMLACQTTRQGGQWDNIRNSLATKSTTSSNYEEMMYILDLSYKNLPRHLKACFLYIGSYPEDHKIRRVDLVRKWVAEGFVMSSSTKQDVWEVAESYFNELVNRSLIQPTYMEMESQLEVSGCRVHDMILDLILRRCKEDNFLHFVTNPKEIEQVKDQVIRRLTVGGLKDVEDGTKLTVSVSKNLSHIRSLTMLKYFDSIPPLLDLKFLRVLSLQDYHDSIGVDLTCINQLSQLRYLNIRGKVMLPCQIRGLQHLETLDLSRISMTAINNSTLDIVDVPCLTNLLLPDDNYLRFRDETNGKVKLMWTFESITGMGELNTLLDLGFQFPKSCAPLAKETWMATLSTSLEKLSNLRQLRLYYDEVVCCADELSSLSPSFNKLEKLYIDGCVFSRVPRWIGHLQNLCALRIGVKQMVQEDFAIIGTGAPSLLILDLWIIGVLTERIVIRGSMGFASVKYFEFNCDCISYLSFEAGAMPGLQELKLVFDANEWDKAAPGGLQHLPRLKKIVSERSMYDTPDWRSRYRAYKDEDKDEEELIRGVFQKAADALPTCPTFVWEDARLIRPVLEEECLNVVD